MSMNEAMDRRPLLMYEGAVGRDATGTLCPVLPDGGVSSSVKDRENDEAFTSDSKED